MILGWLLNPLFWLTLIIVGHETQKGWVFWLGIVLAVIAMLFMRLALKAMGMTVKRLAKGARR